MGFDAPFPWILAETTGEITRYSRLCLLLSWASQIDKLSAVKNDFLVLCGVILRTWRFLFGVPDDHVCQQAADKLFSISKSRFFNLRQHFAKSWCIQIWQSSYNLDFEVEQTLNPDLDLGIVFSLEATGRFLVPGWSFLFAFRLNFGRPSKLHGFILTSFRVILAASGI